MNKRFQFKAPLALAAAAAIGLTAGCGKSPETSDEPETTEDRQAYEVKGRLRQISGDGESVAIEHEEIPGFMAAMTMPFYLEDPALAEGLKPGDAVRFRYVVKARESFIDRMEKLDDDAVPASPAGQEVRRAADPRIPRLGEGDLVPNFELIDHNSERFLFSDFEERAILLTFIFTRCPVPDFCPLMSRNFQVLQERVARHPDLRGKVQLLSVTIDPEYDTPEVLKRYAARYTDDTANWTFATAARDRIDELTTRFSVYIEDDGESANINHALATALVGKDRRLEKIWRGNAWSPDEAIAKLEESLKD